MTTNSALFAIRTRIIVLLLAAVGVIPSRRIEAQNVDCSSLEKAVSANPLDRLGLLYVSDCLGGAKDTDALTKLASKPLDKSGLDAASSTERRLVTLAAIDPVVVTIERARDQLAAASTERRLLATLDSLILLARSSVVAGLSGDSERLLQTGTWNWNSATHSFGALPLDISDALMKSCATLAADQCAAATQNASLILRATRLVRRSLDVYNRPLLTAALGASVARDARWKAYFNETLVQLPWELALNSRLFTKVARAQNGFASPPNYEVVLLHPLVGVEYVWSAPKGSRMTPSAAIELVGYNRWRWSASNKSAGAWGASIVAAYSDRANTDNVGFGLLIRYAHKYGVTITDRSGKLGVLFSSDLGNWLSGKQDVAQNAMRLKLP